MLKTPITDLVSQMFADGMPAISIIAAVREIEIGHRADTSEEFDQFWQLYPNRVGKGAAEKAFQKARRLASNEVLVAGLLRYRAKQDDRLWCNPATWLNQKRWEDEAPQPIAATKGLAGVRARLTQEIANDGYSSPRDQIHGPDDVGRISQLEFFGH